MRSDPAVVADIGGTNARFAVHASGRLEKVWRRPCDEFAGLSDLVRAYVEQAGLRPAPRRIGLAVAGPAEADRVAMTNRDWSITRAGLQALGFDQIILANDFAALAQILPHLGGDQIQRIGSGGVPIADAPCVVVGPGTGLGVAVSTPDGGLVLQTQGGHVGFAPQDEVQAFVLAELRQAVGRVSAEHILSGQGLVRLHHALAKLEDRRVLETSAAMIVEGADADAACRATIDSFLAILADFCGDMALAYGARGGVFVGGGMTPRLRPFLDPAVFRARFEAKGDMAFYTRPVPTWLINDPNAALLGAARMLDLA